MPMSSSGSSLCRRLWIKRLCHDIIHSQYSRSPSLATSQHTRRLSSQVKYQPPPPTFLTPSHIPTTTTTTTNPATTTTLSRKTMEKRTLELVKANHIDDAHILLTNIYQSGHTPSIVTYNHMIKALAKQFRNQQRQLEADALLNDMTRHGVPPNAQTYLQLLLGYSLHSNNNYSTTPSIDILPKMRLLFNRFLDCEHQHGYKRTYHKIKKLVEVMAGVGHGEAILHVMESSFKAGVSLDLTIWHRALSGCTKGGYMDAAEQLLEIMEGQQQQQQQQQQIDKKQHNGWMEAPDATSYDIVIGGYLTRCSGDSSGGVVNMNRAIELFQRMMDNGIVADYRTYQKFLCAYTTTNQDGSMVGQHKDDGNNNNNQQIDTLQRLWQAMIKTMPADLSVGDDTLVTLLTYYVRHEAYSAMEQVYWDLRQRPNNNNHTLSRRSAIYFFKAISGFAKQQHLISGISMFYDLLMYGHGANRPATSSLLHACVLRGQLDMAQQILDVIEETLGTPTAVDHYTTMLKAYVQQGQLEMASKMFIKVQQFYDDTGNLPSASPFGYLSSSYRAMIQGYFRAYQSKLANSLFQQWVILQKQQQQQQQNDKSSFNNKMDGRMVDIMVEGYGLVGDGDTKLDEFLARRDVAISNIRTRTILIQSKLQLGNVEGAEQDLKDGLKNTDIKLLLSSVQAVLSGMALNGNVASCEYWVNRLSAKGLMDDRSYMALLVCYGKAGEKVKLQRTYDDLNQRGIQLEDGIENKVKLEWLETDVYT